MRPSRIAVILIKLKHLAEDQRGKPEGDAAYAKIKELIAKYPEVRAAIVPYWDFTTCDYVFLKRHGVNMEGRWTGDNLRDAIRLMQEDYCKRYMDYVNKETGETYGVLIERCLLEDFSQLMIGTGENEPRGTITGAKKAKRIAA